MKSWLQLNGLWRLVSGLEKKPASQPEVRDSTGAVTSPAVPADEDKLERWEIKAGKAAGALKTAISSDLRVLIRDCEDDPLLIWDTLRTSFIQQRTAPRFNAYHALLDVQKRDSESLEALINRVDEQIRIIKSLSPSTFTLTNLYDELAVMAIIRALPHSFDDVVRTISVLDKFDKQSVIQSLRNMDQTRSNLSGTSTAFSAHSASQRASQKPSPAPTPSSSSSQTQDASNKPQNRPKCDFCSRLGHLEAKCFLKDKLMRQISPPSSSTAAPATTSSQPTPSAPQSASIASASALSSVTQSEPHSSWNADTGASAHMTFNRHWMRNMKPHCIPIRIADGSVLYSEGIGSVRFIPVIEGQEKTPLEFTNVLYVPSLSSNLFSVLYLTMHRHFSVSIEKDTLNFIRGAQTMFQAKISPSTNAAFLVGESVPVEEFASLSSTITLPLDLDLWHRRLCHHHLAGVKKLLSGNLVTGFRLDAQADPDPVCEACKAGKMHADPFPTSHSRATRPLQLVHSDVHGPVKVSTNQGYRFWVSFIDDFSRFKAVYLLKHKSETFAAFKQFKSWAENVTGERLGSLRDDKGGEYMSREFEAFCIDHGIQRQHTVRNRPQQNGVAERANRSMEEGVISMLYESGVPLSFWGEALSSFIHVSNRFTTAALQGVTPHEAFLGTKPDLSHLRVWGCTAYVLIQRDKRPLGSLGAHMEKCIFIGYPQGYKGWKFYNPETRKAVISERADFDERFFMLQRHSAPQLPPPPPDSLLETPSPPLMHLPETLDDFTDDLGDLGRSQMPVHGGDGSTASEQPSVRTTAHQHTPVCSAASPQRPVRSQTPPSTYLSLPPSSPSPSPPRAISPPPTPPIVPAPPALHSRPQRNKRPRSEWLPEQWAVPQRYRQIREPTPAIPSSDEEDDDSDDPIDLLNAHSASVIEPTSYKQSQQRPEAQLWHTACEEEMDAHSVNGTWDVVKLPPGKRAIGSRWFMKVKHNADGSLDRYKARLVAKGYSQRPGFDFKETFAPTVRYSTIRTILAIAALEDLELRSVDISHAYLNGTLEEEIYMQQPEGFEVGGPDHVCRLRKSLYGLKQAGRVWNKTLHSVLTSMGFNRVQSDHGLYIYHRDDVRILMPVFVDDITLAGTDAAQIDSIVLELSQHFKLRDLGPTTQLLGMEIHRDRPNHRLYLSQSQHIANLLQEHGLQDCKPVSTPLNPGSRLSTSMSPQNDAEVSEMRQCPYVSVVGSIMYLAVTTRPDIAYAAGVLARFNSNPGPAHWQAAKHVLRYLKGTIDHCIIYQPSDSPEPFITYSDADHGGNPDNGKSTGGYVVKIGSGAVSWSSKLQPLVALSTTEAEHISAVEAGKEILWMRQFMGEIGQEVSGPSLLRMDNQSAIAVSKNPEHHGKMKHLSLRLFWLRDAVQDGLIAPTFVATGDIVEKRDSKGP
jgi:transposase InsO family protein